MHNYGNGHVTKHHCISILYPKTTNTQQNIAATATSKQKQRTLH